MSDEAGEVTGSHIQGYAKEREQNEDADPSETLSSTMTRPDCYCRNHPKSSEEDDWQDADQRP